MQADSRANLLIVNDRPEQLVALGTVLGPIGENLVMARSGEEALRKLLHQEFAVVLLDVHMPGLDGFETAALIRQRGCSRSTPIIFLTAYGQGDAQIARSYSLGAVDFIQTPIVPEILRAKVGVFVQLHKKSEELRFIRELEHQRELKAANEKLEAETKRNLFFVLSIDLLAVAGFDSFFKQTNPAWEKALGFTEEELKAEPFYEFAHPDDRASTESQFERLKAGAAITYFEHRFRCKSGHYKWLGWTAAPFAADQLVYIFARDITERRGAEEQIRSLNRQLERRVKEVTSVNHELEAFTYSISHDLRAPLRSMQGFAQMLLGEFAEILPEQALDYASRIVQSADYMDQLLRDLLEYSRINQVEFETTRVDLDAVLAEVLASMDTEIRCRQAQINPDGPLGIIVAHHVTVRQILSNLIANALKFVSPGTAPRVRIWTEQVPPEAIWPSLPLLRLCVQDNGIGIAPDQHEKIFGLFQRTHTRDAYPGTGIGLAIVRKGAERMGGRAGVNSQPEQGSCFWVDLPAANELTQEKSAA